MTRPRILVVAGHDPSGGAGMQADIEAAAAHRVHAATLLTLLTRQDTGNVHAVQAVDDAFFAACFETLTHDMDFAAIKTGAIASVGQIERVAAYARIHSGIALVVDPVLKASGGGRLAADPVGRMLRETLFPLARVITPNAAEARLLCDGERDIQRCGAELAGLGCDVLITGGDEDGESVINLHFSRDHGMRRYQWPRLDGVFHGSGCTLASSIAARLARGEALDAALVGAQDYVWRCLRDAFAAGRGQPIPARHPAAAP